MCELALPLYVGAALPPSSDIEYPRSLSPKSMNSGFASQLRKTWFVPGAAYTSRPGWWQARCCLSDLLGEQEECAAGGHGVSRIQSLRDLAVHQGPQVLVRS